MINYDSVDVDGLTLYYDTDIGEDHSRFGVRWGEVKILYAIEFGGVLYDDADEWDQENGLEMGGWDEMQDHLNN